MELTGTKCTLRPWRTDDADALVRHANNRKIWRNMCERFPHPYTAEKANEWLGEPIHSAVPHTSFAISIDGEAVGGTGFSILDDVHRTTARAGYWIAEPLWGRGIVTEAFSLLCNYIFRGICRCSSYRSNGVRMEPRVVPRAGEMRIHTRRADAKGLHQRRSGDRCFFIRTNPLKSVTMIACCPWRAITSRGTKRVFTSRYATTAYMQFHPGRHLFNSTRLSCACFAAKTRSSPAILLRFACPSRGPATSCPVEASFGNPISMWRRANLPRLFWMASRRTVRWPCGKFRSSMRQQILR